MAYYRKKPVIIEAFRFGFDDAPDFGEEDEEEFAWVHSSNCEYPED